MNFYNEIDPFAAAWLRELIKAGHIAPGVVDERSIEDIKPDELKQYTQCHFFAGIGVWSYALRRAGWPDDRPVWTGSCPCQPFSTAGKRTGTADERHLWPSWFHLISECMPSNIFGEQVDAAIRYGWLDIVSSDLEGIGYTFGAVGLPAASAGAPHTRPRLYITAALGHAKHNGPLSTTQSQGITTPICDNAQGTQSARKLTGASARAVLPTNFWGECEWIKCGDGNYRAIKPGAHVLVNGTAARVGRLRGYGNAIVAPVAEAFIRAYLESETD